MDKRIKDCIREAKKIRKEIEKLEKIDAYREDIKKQLDELYLKLSDYEENVYAKIIFEVCSVQRPKLVRIRTKEIYDWESAFGTDFAKLKKSDKYALIGLFEDGGRYKFK